MNNQTKENLSLEDIQAIIGQSILDKSIQKELAENPDVVASRLGISCGKDEATRNFLKTIGSVLTEQVDPSAALEKIGKEYEDTTDGIIQTKCA